MGKASKSVLISVICLMTVNALAAVQSMRVVGNSLRDAVELLGYSLFGPFTGGCFRLHSEKPMDDYFGYRGRRNLAATQCRSNVDWHLRKRVGSVNGMPPMWLMDCVTLSG